jgi:hypothetical protein
MLRRVVLIAGICFIAAPTMCSDFTNAFSTTKFCTGFFVGLTPFLAAQAFKKVAHHAFSHAVSFAGGSVVSAIAFHLIGSLSHMGNSRDKNLKKSAESFLGGFAAGFAGAPLTLLLVNTM